MKKLLILMLLVFPFIAHGEVETEILCFRAFEGNDIKFEFRTYHDPAAKWSGALVKYATSKESIPLVHKSTEQEATTEGGSYLFVTRWSEVVGGAITGEYVMVRQGPVIYAMSYKNAKSKKRYSFERYPSIKSSPETGCQW